MKRKFLSLFIAVIMVATVLTACGGNKNKKEDQNNTKQSNSGTDSKNNQSNKTDSKDGQSKTDSKDGDNGSAQMSKDKLVAELKQRFTLAYFGLADDNSEIYWAFAPGVKSGMILIVSADKSQSVFLIGSIEEVGADSLKITDEKTGKELKVKVEKVSDKPEDGIKLTTENNRIAVLLPMPADKVIDKMFEAAGE